MAALSGFHYLPAVGWPVQTGGSTGQLEEEEEEEEEEEANKQVPPFSLRTNSALV